MAGPADQAAANVQAMNESLAQIIVVPNAATTLALAAAAITANDWTGTTYADYVYDPQDAGNWTARLAATNLKNEVFLGRSGPLKDPYGGGWAGTQFAA